MTRPNEDAQAEYLRTHPEAKPSNPKDAFGSAKVPVGLVPDTALVELALAHLEGACKYGRFNWRVVGVRASIYNDAMERHRKKWWNGQDRDPVTRVRELASVMACCAILIDSEICGVLDDDRPPIAPIGPQLDENMAIVAHLKELFKAHAPHQYTWEDSPQVKALNDHMQAGISEALGAGPLEPEGFPGGYSVENGPADAGGQVDTLVIGVPGTGPGYRLEVTDPTPEDAKRRHSPAVTVTIDPPIAGPLQLDCGCVKRCKGHATENFRAAPVAVHSSPGNYALERAAGQTETCDAEFPHAPVVLTDPREFDPAD